MQRIVIGPEMSRAMNARRASESESIARCEFDALLGTGVAPPTDVHCVDELLERIEDSEPRMRFVPDWSDESFKNAA
jgi:hypothetical protein